MKYPLDKLFVVCYNPCINMKNLSFPTYRTIQDATSDEHLGKMSVALWAKVEQDIVEAIEDNSRTWDELERRFT